MAANDTGQAGPADGFTFIVVGGGIAGVSCAETLCSQSPESSILLLTASPLIKAVINFRHLTKVLEDFDVEERPMQELDAEHPNVTVIHKTMAQLDTANKIVETSDGFKYSYKKLCICMGGSPKVIAKDHPYVLGIRDTETVKVFQKKLENATRIVIVGNGGIATELAYEVEGCEVVWAVKDATITSTFIDGGAAEFLLPTLQTGKQPQQGPLKRMKYKLDDDVSGASTTGTATTGSALGPDWSEGLAMHGLSQVSHQVHVEYEVGVKQLLSPDELQESGLIADDFPYKQKAKATTESWPVYVQLTNGRLYGCDFVVSATGVEPCTQMFADKFDLHEDGGILVDDKMTSSAPDVYSAGDVCHANWTLAPYWIQMRLWSQARQMGAYAAMCMAASLQARDVQQDFCFELFAHVTKFFNYKVVLLGKFNAQGLGNDHELLVRVTKGQEYVKVVLKDGRMYGAILIGDTDLEETFENLILNQLDLSAFTEHLLDPGIDIEDFFD